MSKILYLNTDDDVVIKGHVTGKNYVGGRHMGENVPIRFPQSGGMIIGLYPKALYQEYISLHCITEIMFNLYRPDKVFSYSMTGEKVAVYRNALDPREPPDISLGLDFVKLSYVRRDDFLYLDVYTAKYLNQGYANPIFRDPVNPKVTNPPELLIGKGLFEISVTVEIPVGCR